MRTSARTASIGKRVTTRILSRCGLSRRCLSAWRRSSCFGLCGESSDYGRAYSCPRNFLNAPGGGAVAAGALAGGVGGDGAAGVFFVGGVVVGSAAGSIVD